MQPVNQPSRNPVRHLFIQWSIQPTIQQQSVNSSSILSATQTSYHPFIHKAIYPISHPSKRCQFIRPSNFLVSWTFIHPTAIFSYNHPYSSNLCTHCPFFQSPKHPIIHPFTKLSIQSAIHPTGISQSIHLTTKSAVRPFIRRAIIHPLIHPTNHTAAICKLIVHPFTHPNILSYIHSQSYLSNQSIIQVALFFPSIWITSQPTIYSFIQKKFHLINHPSMQSAIHPSNLLLPAIRSSKNQSV